MSEEKYLKVFGYLNKGHFIEPSIKFFLPADSDIIDVKLVQDSDGITFLIAYACKAHPIGVQSFEINRYYSGDSMPEKQVTTGKKVITTVFEKIFLVNGVVNLIRISKCIEKT